MISDVDDALAELLRQEALEGTEVDVVLDAPTTDWAARRTAPVVDLFMYDVREDVERRNAHTKPRYNELGRIVGRQPGARFFRLAYLVSAWTARPEDEHRVLGRLLECLIRFDAIPERFLSGRLEGERVQITVARPTTEDRSLTDLWNALGGDMKPSLDVVVMAPLTPRKVLPVGPPVAERRVDANALEPARPGAERVASAG